MLSPRYSKQLIALIACALTLVACEKDKEQPTALLTSDDSILSYVPADTPYVIANLTPLPDALMDKFEPKIDALLKSYQTVIREAVRAKQADLAAADHDSEEMRRVAAVVDEVTSLMSIDGLKSVGIDRNSPVAFYGNGLLPVIRIGLTDGALFDDAISRIEEKAEYELPIARLGDQPYRFFVADQAKVVIAVAGNQAVVTVVPANFDEAQLSEVLGLTMPAANIADAGTLEAIAKEFGFTGHQIGFIDAERIVQRFIDSPSGLDADLLALMDYDASTLSDVCREEIRATARVAPRMVLGTSELSDKQIKTRMMIGLRDDIAAGLAALPAAVPGLGGEHSGLMSFGVSMDFKAARGFYEARLDALEADPYECELFADLQNGVAAGRQALNQPMPPMVYDFRGFLAVVEDIDGIDFASKTPPKSVDARVLLAMDNARALIALASMFSPELASMDLQTDGKPVRLESSQLKGVVDGAFVAMTDDAIALSVGEGTEARLGDMLGAAAPSPSPVFSMSMDAARYYGLIGDAIAAAEPDDGDAPPPEMQAAMGDIMQVLSDLYDRIAVEILFTERGVEIESSMTIGD